MASVRTSRKAPKYKLDLQVDDRTQELSDKALYCRSRGHKWEEQAIGQKRFLELVAQGQHEESFFCDNGCGATYSVVYALRERGKVVTQKRNYPRHGEYLLPKGSGRLDKGEARVAAFARRFPAYA